ncbi:MAG: hypothetical protein P0116_04710 [Candidatus Nitrosocosmicus sp.]|nr:hypothetical protein [Candidatus Nitrosocosmicus sp.]
MVCCSIYNKISGAQKSLIIEAITGIAAVGLYALGRSWVLNKLKLRKWIEFVKAKRSGKQHLQAVLWYLFCWLSLYGEGFETVLFFISSIFFCKIYGDINCRVSIGPGCNNWSCLLE